VPQLSPTAAVRSSSAWLIAAAFALALASIGVVTALQQRASSARDAEVVLTAIGREFDGLQSIPYDTINAPDAAVRAGVVSRMWRSEDRIEARFAQLVRDHPSPGLLRARAPFRANVATLHRVRRLLVRGQNDEADAFGPVAGLQQAQLARELDRTGVVYRRRASSWLRLATAGSAATILVLVSLFSFSYLRSRKAHARVEGLSDQNARLLVEDLQLQVLHRLALAAEYRDDDTGQHTSRVAELAVRVGTALGMPTTDLALLRQAAPLHDVGKIAIPDHILLKPGRLTREEFGEMQRHTTLGAEMLAGPGLPLLEMAEQVALTHHERWDGSGYPAGLAGTAIPLAGRIVAIADVFDALTHSRPYKEAWPVADAVAEIRRQRGTQFDPAVVDAFLAVLPDLALAGTAAAATAGARDGAASHAVAV
jgi:putative nucleotidyltransferase with HDIG domain